MSQNLYFNIYIIKEIFPPGTGVKLSRIQPDPRSGTSVLGSGTFVWGSGTWDGRSVTLKLRSGTQYLLEIYQLPHWNISTTWNDHVLLCKRSRIL